MMGSKPELPAGSGVTGPVIFTVLGDVSWDAIVFAINAASVTAIAVNMAIEERRIRRAKVSGISFDIWDQLRSSRIPLHIAGCRATGAHIVRLTRGLSENVMRTRCGDWH
jgi:hypothetical protein